MQKLENTTSNNIITLDNFVNTDVESAKEKLKMAGLTPIILGNGTTVTKQYPNKETTVLIGSRVFLKTNNAFTLPDVTGYTKSELIALCTLLNINYEIVGSGKVVSASAVVGSQISNDKITFNLE